MIRLIQCPKRERGPDQGDDMRTHDIAVMIFTLLGLTCATFAQSTQPSEARPTQAEPAGATGANGEPRAADAADATGRDLAEIRREQQTRTLATFLEHVHSSPDVQPAAREAIDQLWAQRRPDDDPRAFMDSALAVLYPPYKQAADALDAGNPAATVDAALPLAEHADTYLSAHAALLAARALIEQERGEDAQRLLEVQYERRADLHARTFLAPELTFLLGYSRLSNLDYDGAATIFKEFEQSYPDAPEHFRLPARQMLQELTVRRPEALGDVCDLMNYAGRQLRHARAGEAVRARQDRAVELLTKLIDDAEQREQQQQQQQQQQNQQQQQKSDCKKCGGKGCPDCPPAGAQGNQQPQRGADRSTAPPGQGRVGDLHASSRARPGEQWGQMRPEERERVLQSLRQNYPSRYRQLVEQYYKQLSKED